MQRSVAAVLLALLLSFFGMPHVSPSAAQQTVPGGSPGSAAQLPAENGTGEPWREALIALPVAALLGAALAFRPVRRGTPPRDAAVIQTQIVLAVIGAVIMLVVGASLARAFGIVGAASLVRYRSRIDDPKDAAVMLAALGIGLASGVGIYLVAAISALFILVVLWVLESIEPTPRKEFELELCGKGVDELRPNVETLLRRNRVRFELRTAGQEELSYQVKLPVGKRTDELSNAILQLDTSKEVTVEWDEKKKK